jgi:probable rRNA maturation factor
VLGDVVISVETAARQADTHGVSLHQELELLVTHGILHLLGYDDLTDEGAEEMQRKERALGVRQP